MKKISKEAAYRQKTALVLREMRRTNNGRMRALGYLQAVRENEQYECAKEEHVFEKELKWKDLKLRALVSKLKAEIGVLKKHPVVGHIFRRLRIRTDKDSQAWLTTADSSAYDHKKLPLEDFRLLYGFSSQLPENIDCIIMYPRGRLHAAKMWREEGVWKVDEDFNTHWGF